MTFRDTLGLALRNLGEAKLRTSLTTMGVSIGIASLAGMVSLGVGLQDQFVGRFTKSGVFDAITVTPGQDRAGFAGALAAGRGGRRTGFGARRRAQRSDQPSPEAAAMRTDLNDDTIKELAALDQVRDVFPNIQIPVEAKYGDESEPTLAGGVPMSARGEGPFGALAYGSFFSGDSAAECMLSLPMAKRIDDVNPQSLVGKQLILAHAGNPGGPPAAGAGGPVVPTRAETPFTIVGIVERETGPLGGTIAVSGVMIPLGRAKEILTATRAAAQAMGAPRPAERPYNSIIVKITHPQHTQDVQERIRARGFSAFSLNDALQGAKRAFMVLDIVLSLIGSIALAVSSLGIMNTMVMSILERTREIGIMKAIGGSDGDIRRIFLIEASAIGLFERLSLTDSGPPAPWYSLSPRSLSSLFLK